MSNVINFNDYDTKYNQNSKEILSFFDKYNRKIENFIKNTDLKNDPLFLKQYDEFNRIYESLIENKRWINDSKKENVLRNEKKIILDDKKEEEAFNEENEYNTYAYFLTYILCIDKTKGEIFNLDDEYIKLIVHSLSSFYNININKYKDILKSLMNNQIIELIKNDEQARKKPDLDEIIDLLKSGKDISTIVSIFYESNSYEMPKLDDVMLTIDNIHDYYINQVNLFLIDDIDDETYSVIDLIVMLNHTDLNIRNMYVKLVYQIRSKKIGLLRETKYIKNLTEVFMYLFVDNDFKNISFETIENIVNLKFINNTSTEQTIEDLNLFNKGEMKI